MSAVEWGVKRRCGKCETPFYDLLRDPIRCPKCGTVFRAEAAGPRSPSKARAPKARGNWTAGAGARSSHPMPGTEALDPIRIDADKARADEEADQDQADEDTDEAEPDSGDVPGDDEADDDEAPRDG